ncbi:MAG: hypothetical protein QM758_05350 [Armatimonas sp.]
MAPTFAGKPIVLQQLKGRQRYLWTNWEAQGLFLLEARSVK